MPRALGEATVKITADTSQLDRTLGRMRWGFWLFAHGPVLVLSVVFLLGLVLGAVGGVVLS